MSEKKSDANSQIRVVSEGFYGEDVSVSFADLQKIRATEKQNETKNTPSAQNDTDKQPKDKPKE